MEEKELNLILESIQKEYENQKLNSKDLKLIIELCNTLKLREENLFNRYIQYQNFITNNKDINGFDFYDMSNFMYPKYSKPFPQNSNLPEEFISEFKEEFQDKYEKTSHIYSNIADEIFSNNIQVIVIYLAQIRSEILLCIKRNEEYYQINDVEELTKIDSAWIDNFDSTTGLGSALDTYLVTRRPNKLRNTRKFEITRNVYEYLKDNNHESIILFPAICMDDDINNPTKESYKHRYTYMITFGEKSLDFRTLADILIFDRNGLCPPGTC
ncbi:hypothetical protein [Chryseobacterium sp. EO14]|uniref:hypothetical protein n=1 Tax=Chryseobacterium sp. EO14 TaxID=2950551 RepID=UPI00210A18E8|nr:hypothetical protein [Chryseobacterium sp. EO14]MCQ4138886.1 hypothetical protein [Chryseobacterium sp. EO14]